MSESNTSNTEPDESSQSLANSKSSERPEIRDPHKSPKDQKVQEAIRKMGGEPEKLKEVTEFMMMMGSGPFPNPLHQKMTDVHISKILEITSEHDEREFKLLQRDHDRKDTNRWFSLAVLVIILIAVLVVCILFKEKPEVLIPILTGILGFGAGALGGYGYGKSKDD